MKVVSDEGRAVVMKAVVYDNDFNVEEYLVAVEDTSYVLRSLETPGIVYSTRDRRCSKEKQTEPPRVRSE